MTAATLTIADFLLARIADDEAVARMAAEVPNGEGGSWWVDGPALKSGKHWVYATGEKFEHRSVAQHIARHDPARVLAECAAKRKIVEGHGDYHVCPNFSDAGSTDYVGKYDEPGMRPCPTLLALLSIYADHSDYRSEWAS